MSDAPGSRLSPPAPHGVPGRWRRELLSQVPDQVGEGVAVFDVYDRLVYANPALAALPGCSVDALVGQHLSAFIDVPDDAGHGRADAEALEVTAVRVELSSRRLGGTPLDVEVSLSPLRENDGTRVGTIVCVRDVTARKLLEARLERAAMHDPLTDLPNRRLLVDRLDHALTGAARGAGAVAVLFIDLDRFKAVNDLHGHASGDQLLLQVADRFLRCVRDADTLARLGGDEFVVLLEHLEDGAEPARTAERLSQALSCPFDLGEVTVEISASIGIAVSAAGEHRSLLHAADSAMYAAKRAGRGRIVTGHEDDAGSGRRPGSLRH